MATAAARQRRSPPGEAEGEPEAKKMRSLQPPDFAGGRRGVVLNPADCDLDFTVDGDGLRGHALHEDGFAYCWSGARAAIGITAGKYCFGCRILSDQEVQMDDTPADQRHLCRIGTVGGGGFGGTGKFSTAGRFSDYGEKFGAGDTVVCAVDLESSSSAAVGFSLNGRWLGTAWRFDAGELRGSGLFPHVLLKNVAVDMQFSVEDGLVLEEGFKPWSSAVEDGNAIAGPSFLMKWAEDHPEKRYLLLGTNLALDQMKEEELRRALRAADGDGDGDLQHLTGQGRQDPRNYIIDQTNVYRSARKRKLRPFVDFRKIAVVVFPAMDELRWRSEKRVREMGRSKLRLAGQEDTPHADEPFDQVFHRGPLILSTPAAASAEAELTVTGEHPLLVLRFPAELRLVGGRAIIIPWGGRRGRAWKSPDATVGRRSPLLPARRSSASSIRSVTC
ncbi:unnamed protein product [Spirodela intermedia]|uniref:SPRY domain-containing protein n=1 Tax=Spirodela intermedia TaxID=51605 RepID=A0A7I8IL05_SPIIN|nr:unnamed protein product [Spirodela intermedia]CAA6658414.1 unnamed protein product [Spirodela intermedia]